MPGALPAARCLALCVAVLIRVGEGIAADLRAERQLEVHAGERRHEVHRKMIPPAIIDTVSHMKLKGSGYQNGSPLYGRQEAIAHGSAVASISAIPEAPSFNPGSPGFILAAVGLIIGVMCVAGVALWIDHESRRKQINAGMMPASTASLGPSAQPVPYLEHTFQPTSMQQPPSSTQPPPSMQPPLSSMQPPPFSMQPPSSSMQPMHSFIQPPYSSGQQAVQAAPQQPAQLSSQHFPSTQSVPVQHPPVPIPSPSAAAVRSSSPHLQMHPGSPMPSSVSYPSPAGMHVGSPTHSLGSHGPLVGVLSDHSGALPMHSQSLPPGHFESGGVSPQSGVIVLDTQTLTQQHASSWQSQLRSSYGN